MFTPLEVPTAAARLIDVLRARPGAVPENVVLIETGLDAGDCARQVPVLRELGYDVLQLPNRAYQLLAPSPRLLPNEIVRHLETAWVGRALRCYDEVDSTNSVAADLARKGAPAGLAVFADAQTRGRGRLGRSWISPPRRNLYLSIVLRPELPTSELARLSLVAGTAVCDAVTEWCPAEIKWPNDVLVGGRKVAGILTETEGEGAALFVVVGIGVNLNTSLAEFPDDLRDKAGSVYAATGREVDRARFAARLLLQVERWYDLLVREGFAPIAAAWEARSCLPGKSIVVDGPDGRIAGQVIGLQNSGALRLRLPGGGEREITVGDVTVVAGYGQETSVVGNDDCGMSRGHMSQTILVVDDNPDIVMITRSTLEKKGFRVVTANSGLAAIETLKGEKPDAVILDVMMPDVSGWEVLDFLKNEESTARIPVILMSARDRGEQVSAGYAYGADYYLTKPCTRDRLLTAVGQVLRRYDLLPGGEAGAAGSDPAGGGTAPTSQGAPGGGAGPEQK